MSIRFIRTVLFGLVVLCMSAAAFGQIGLMITIAPPPLPVYEQPICPGDGYIWTPGYWAYDSDFEDYYWVPGTWVLAPEIGFLWTPAYWGWGGDRFVFYDGYWGPLVGFYGGVNYGFGYFGVGFEGGRWDNGRFFYNRAVSNVNVTEIHNVYNTTVNVRETENRVSYNGGEGGINARPSAQEEAAARERHLPPVAAQSQHMQQARSNPQQRASVNRGKPEIAATPKPGAFKDRGAVQARAAGGNYNPPANRGGRGGTQPREGAGGSAENAGRESNARPGGGAAGSSHNHVRELPPSERPAPVNTGNAKQDRKYQQEQEKLYSQQQKERQKVTQQQEKEDQRAAKQNDAARQQVEQRHQQQTQQLQQKHQQQQQQMQQRQAPRQAEPSRKPPK
jgi:WXXGXW repeat (2 copies)